jgi:1-deoxy-D-xylulose 5-phosphate reductoisomerase
MKILVYGSKGWIGNQFINILKTLQNQEIIYVEGQSRVDNEKQLMEEFQYGRIWDCGTKVYILNKITHQ